MHDDDGEAGDTPESFDRRSALKKAGLGAGVVGLVWTSPRIEGLRLRSDYAQAASVAPGPTTESFPVDGQTTGGAHARTRVGTPPLAYGYASTFSPPPPTDDALAPTDDLAGTWVGPGPDLFTVTRSTNCATAVDVVWSTAGNVGVAKQDLAAVPAGPYSISRKTIFSMDPSRIPVTIKITFTC